MQTTPLLHPSPPCPSTVLDFIYFFPFFNSPISPFPIPKLTVTVTFHSIFPHKPHTPSHTPNSYISLLSQMTKKTATMEKRFNIFFFLILTLPLLAAGASVSKAQAGVVGTELWCVAKNNAEDAALQTALNWACGPGAADCSPITLLPSLLWTPVSPKNSSSFLFLRS